MPEQDLRVRHERAPVQALVAVVADAIVADPTLDLPYSAAWSGVAPTIEEQDGGIDLRYGLGSRLRGLLRRPRSLTVGLAPAAVWRIELHGGVSALRADLRDLRVSSIALDGDAHDVAFDLPAPRAELTLSVAGAVAGASVKRPAHVPVDVVIEGGAHELSLDGMRLATIAGVVRQRTRAGRREARWRFASAGPRASSPWLPTRRASVHTCHRPLPQEARMPYIEGFVAAVPIANRETYIEQAKQGAEYFKGLGATRVTECWGDDVPHGKVTDFFRATQAKDDETVVFSWIEYPDKATRDAANEKMSADAEAMQMEMPFDASRMFWGGFEPVLDE